LAKPLPIRSWEIWNEPNLPRYFTNVAPVRKYATLLRISHQVIKGEDRHANVVLAGLAAYTSGHLAPFRAWDFLSRLYKAKLKPDFDVVGFHPYAASVPQLRFVMNRMRKTIKHHGDGKTPLWLTEIGWGSKHPSRSAPLNKGLRGQKRELQRSFSLLVRERRHWHIKGISYWDWIDPASPPPNQNCTFCSSSGLIRHTDEPKPSWGAYKRIIRRAR
jgi:hypothetical protein